MGRVELMNRAVADSAIDDFVYIYGDFFEREFPLHSLSNRITLSTALRSGLLERDGDHLHTAK